MIGKKNTEPSAAVPGAKLMYPEMVTEALIVTFVAFVAFVSPCCIANPSLKYSGNHF